jgi:hypothetical protein
LEGIFGQRKLDHDEVAYDPIKAKAEAKKKARTAERDKNLSILSKVLNQTEEEEKEDQANPNELPLGSNEIPLGSKVSSRTKVSQVCFNVAKNRVK